MEDALSVGQLWYDPTHRDEYLKENTLLPDFNGENGPIPKYKKNFLRLKKAAFLAGHLGDATFEDGIDPWFSGIFSFYDANMKTINTTSSYVYSHDTFGLKTMDERGDLIFEIAPDTHHNDWIANEKTFRKYVLPLLT